MENSTDNDKRCSASFLVRTCAGSTGTAVLNYNDEPNECSLSVITGYDKVFEISTIELETIRVSMRFNKIVIRALRVHGVVLSWRWKER